MSVCLSVLPCIYLCLSIICLTLKLLGGGLGGGGHRLFRLKPLSKQTMCISCAFSNFLLNCCRSFQRGSSQEYVPEAGFSRHSRPGDQNQHARGRVSVEL